MVESVTLHYLKAWNRLINSCYRLPLTQFLAETHLSIDDSPFFAHEQDTVGTFPAPPDPTGKVSCPPATLPFPQVPCLPNHRCNKTMALDKTYLTP